MGWRDWLGLQVTPEKFARLMIEQARKQGLGHYVHAPETDELLCHDDDHKGVIYLGRVYGRYCKAPRKERQKIIDDFLSSMSEKPENKRPADYASARSRLLPIVRDRIDISIGELMSRRFDDASKQDATPLMAHAPLVGSLIAGIAFDTPTAIQRLTDKDLRDWGVDVPTALDDAIDNLRAQTRPGGWTQLDADVWSGDWGDAYASSRMLTPEIIHQTGVPDPLVMAPCPEFILVADGRNPRALQALGGWAEQAAERGGRQLSFEVYRLSERQWEPMQLDEQQGLHLLNLQTRAAAVAYADQKQMLEDWHERQHIDLWVASVQLHQDQRTGRVRSLGIWTLGVDSLLPRTDLLVLQQLDEQGNKTAHHLIVLFDAALAALPGALEPCADLAPVRYATKRHPTPDEWVALAAQAVELAD